MASKKRHRLCLMFQISSLALRGRSGAARLVPKLVAANLQFVVQSNDMYARSQTLEACESVR